MVLFCHLGSSRVGGLAGGASARLCISFTVAYRRGSFRYPLLYSGSPVLTKRHGWGCTGPGAQHRCWLRMTTARLYRLALAETLFVAPPASPLTCATQPANAVFASKAIRTLRCRFSRRTTRAWFPHRHLFLRNGVCHITITCLLHLSRILHLFNTCTFPYWSG